MVAAKKTGQSKKTKSLYQELSKQVKTRIAKEQRQEKMTVQEAICQMRKARNLTGVEFCRLAGDMDPKTLTALEKGRIRNPSIKTLESCARALGVTVSALFKEAEMHHEKNFVVGTQKGAFVLEFPHKKVKIVSFTPLVREFFCGKMTLGSKVLLGEELLRCEVPLYLSCLVGRVEITVEGQKNVLREGQNIFFNGVLEHSFYNPLHKEVSMLIMMAPSFLK